MNQDLEVRELCAELYRLKPEWDNTLAGAKERWVELPDGSWESLRLSDVEANGFDKQLWFDGIPAYDLGYLLRKLPYKVKDEYQYDQFGVHLKQTGGGGWTIYYGEPGKDSEMYFNSADTPEDAACKLAIELIKQKVITV